MNPPVPYQAQSGNLEDHSSRDDYPKNPKFSIVVAGHMDVQSEASYNSRSLTWLVKRTIMDRTHH
jgi:heme-binding NEAT domain protein